MVHFEIRDLSFSYPLAKNDILSHIDLSIDRGAYITVCGKSGSGKTTLLRHLKSVLTPHGRRSGQILFEGRKLEDVDLREQSSKIGYVMQNPDSQIVTDKVWHELAFGLESLGTDQKTMRIRVAEMASYFGIQDWFHKPVASLSGGQKQLLNLASIMAMQPGVLILDEPTSQLDPIAAADFLNTVRKINRELRTTIIITEHRLEDILYASDRVVVMDRGQIIAQDSPDRIGEMLKGKHDDMFEAMPAPVQIYYGLPNAYACPLTVREGGEWLDQLFQNKQISQPRIEEKDTLLPENADSYALEIKEGWFRYEKDLPDVLKGVDLQVPAASIFAVVGGNGTGKSTLLKSICGINKIYRGNIWINGKRLKQYKQKELFQGCLAMLPQDPQSLFAHKTVREELQEMLEKDSGAQQRLNETAQLCEISELLDQHPYDLSGGEMQRTALAKVLLTNPGILLLDEPTKGIDCFFKKQFAQILKKLKAKGVTVVMVSHDVEFCARYADTVSMFFDGSILTTNTPNRFFSQNSFYTTAANRMSRHVFENAITSEDVIALCQRNLQS